MRVLILTHSSQGISVKYPTMSYEKIIFSCLQYEARYMEALVVTGTHVQELKESTDVNSQSSDS